MSHFCPQIYQGVRAAVQDNTLLGLLTLTFPARRRGTVDIQATFHLDVSGLLSVTASERLSGATARAEFQSEGRLTDRELRDILRQGELFQRQDDETRENAWRERFRV